MIPEQHRGNELTRNRQSHGWAPVVSTVVLSASCHPHAPANPPSLQLHVVDTRGRSQPGASLLIYDASDPVAPLYKTTIPQRLSPLPVGSYERVLARASHANLQCHVFQLLGRDGGVCRLAPATPPVSQVRLGVHGQ